MKYLYRTLPLCLTLLLLTPIWLQAGNKKMITQRVQELNQENREAIHQLAKIPKNGNIELNVRAIPQSEGYLFEYMEKETPKATTKQFELIPNTDTPYTTMREGLLGYVVQPPEIRELNQMDRDAGYIPFTDSIRRYIRRPK